MNTIPVLAAEARDRAGKGSARAARRAGLVPAVIYGAHKAPEIVTLPFRVVDKEYRAGNFTNTIYEIEVGGARQRVLPRDIQIDPVRDWPVHVDFLRVDVDTLVVVHLPVHFTNQTLSPGIKRGGMLNIVRHEIEARCPPDSIPEFIEIDVASYDIGDSIHISAVSMPAGVKPTISDRDFTIATIVPPTVQPADEGEAAEA